MTQCKIVAFGVVLLAALVLAACNEDAPTADTPMVRGLRPGLSMEAARELVLKAGATCTSADGVVPLDVICLYPPKANHRVFYMLYNSLGDKTVTELEYKLNVTDRSSTLLAINGFYGTNFSTGICNEAAWTNTGDVATICFHDENADHFLKLYITPAPMAEAAR